jgi:predicted amidophosphoribosyltransferase
MEKDRKTVNQCKCPYCDIPISEPSPFCGGCGNRLRFCSECGYVIPRMVERCPQCGAKKPETIAG